MDDMLNKAKEVAGEVGEKGKDILGDLAKEGREIVDLVKDLFDGDEPKEAEEKPAAETPKPEA